MAKNRDKQRENRRLYGCEMGTDLLDTHATAGYKDLVPALALNKYIRGNKMHEKELEEMAK